MAGGTELLLPIGVEALRIDDGIADGGSRGSRDGELCMLRSVAVATLAVNAFRQGGRIDGARERLLMPSGNLRVGVVAEHALVGDGPAEALVAGAIVARIHGPVAAVLRVPAERQLDDRTFRRAIHIGAGVVARAHDVVDALLHYVDLRACGVELVTALKDLAVADRHREVA